MNESLDLLQESAPQCVVDNGGISEKLWNNLHDLFCSSKDLEKAIINCQTDEVWRVLEEKETKANAMQQTLNLWLQIFNSEEQKQDPELTELRTSLRNKINQLQICDMVNKSLIRNYLQAIEKSFVQAGAGLAGRKKVYGKKGRLGVKSSSFILKTNG